MRRRIGWLPELQRHRSGVAGECKLSCRGEGDTVVVAARERWKEWGEEKKKRKKEKKKGGKGRWGAGQLGPTSLVLTCGTVPRQKTATWQF